MNQGDIEEAEEKILSLLRKEMRPLTTDYIYNKVNIPKFIASSALYSLLKKGLIKRVYTDSYDPTRPFDTASWIATEGEFEAKESQGTKAESAARHIRLVLSVPLSMISQRATLLNKYEALDLHDAYMHVIEIAKRELKIMSPIIDAYAFYPLVTKILNSRELNIKILTELKKSRDLPYLLGPLKSGNASIEVRDVARSMKYEGYEMKAFGIHAKLIIADNEMALIGSFNLSRHHYLVDFDIGFLISDPETVAELSSIFNALWDYVSANR